MGITAAFVVPWAIGAGVTYAGAEGYNTLIKDPAKKSKNEQADAIKQQTERQANLEQELKQRQSNQESDAESSRVRDEARRRQKQQAIGAYGSRDTILTSPLGVSGQAGGSGKSLLGQ